MDVVKIFLILSKKIPAKLLLIGDGPERPEIEAIYPWIVRIVVK